MIHDIASLLLELALKSSVILVCVFILVSSVRRFSSEERHLIWVLAIVGLLVLPVMSFIVPKVELPLKPLSNYWQQYNDDSDLATKDRVGPHLTLINQSTLQQTDGQQPRQVLKPELEQFVLIPLVVRSYCVVALLLLVYFGFRLLQINRLVYSLDVITSAELLTLLDNMRTQIGIRRKVLMLTSPSDHTPWVWGLNRPVIVLPHDFENWPEESQHNALVHEMSHIDRLDFLTLVLGYLCCALYWFQPLSWLALNRMNREGEKACDDRVLLDGASHTIYARQLLEIADKIYCNANKKTLVMAMTGSSKVSQRIQSILDLKIRRRSVSKLKMIIALIITLGLVGPLATLNSQETISNGPISQLDDPGFQSLVSNGPTNDDELSLIVRTYIDNNMQPEAVQALVVWLTRQKDTEYSVCNYCEKLIRSNGFVARNIEEYKVLQSAFNNVEKTAYESSNGKLFVRLAAINVASKNRNHLARGIYYYSEALRVGNLTKPGEIKLNIAIALSGMGNIVGAKSIMNQMHQDESSDYYQSKTTQSWIKYLDSRIDFANRMVTRLIDSESIGADEYLPLSKNQPVYPETALKEGKEGNVVVEFTVTSTGRTKDVVVVSSTDSIFEEPTVEVASDFLYMPRIVDGKPVDVPGVQNKITFAINY